MKNTEKCSLRDESRIQSLVKVAECQKSDAPSLSLDSKSNRASNSNKQFDFVPAKVQHSFESVLVKKHAKE